MNYDLSATTMLKILGYDQPIGGEWLEKIKQNKNICLPKTYMEFMELMVDCPLLGTSNLWVGKMAHKAAECIPCTLYDQLQEMIDDRKDRWSKRPGKYERALYELFQLPVEEWPKKVDDYFVIGSDYAGGVGEFGIRVEDLQEDDPPVYWHKYGDGFSAWKLENEKLSDFLLNVLIEALACVDYQSAEYELETKGWRYEEYFDIKKDDWVATKSVLKRYGIDYSIIKKYKANSGKVFFSYDENRKAFFVGSTAEGEMSLSAINRYEAENIFLDLNSLEYFLEEARLCIKDKERAYELQQLYLYTKTPKTEVRLSDYCEADKPPQKGENGETICPTTVNKEPLYVLCSGVDFMEAVFSSIQKKPKATNEELIIAFNSYLQIMLKFVQAIPEDVEYLRSFAYKSEAHWGYDKKFMDTFDSIFNITEQFVLNNPVYVIWKNSIPVAFWGLRYDCEMWELEYFYVSEADLGKGYGKQMWNHMTNWCKEHKIRKIHFVTSHQAIEFYEKMGAVQDGMSQSMIDGRSIPHFIYEL